MKTFHPLTEFPSKKGTTERSEFVLLFDKDGHHFFEFSYYDFEFKKWVNPYFERYEFVCWCYIPNPNLPQKKAKVKRYKITEVNLLNQALKSNGCEICPTCGKYKTLQGNGIMHQLCECGINSQKTI